MFLQRITFLFAISIAFGLAACGGAANNPAPNPALITKLNVVSTVSPLVNIIYNVGGNRIELSGIIPEGTDSHTFEPAPSDAKKLAAADIIFVNGLSLEDPTEKLAKANMKPTAELIEFGPQTIPESQYVYDFSFPKDGGKPNPHLWTDPTKALRYAEIARDALIRRDPKNTEYYRNNFDTFKARIEQLDTAIKTAVATIPEKNRKLLTYHDSFPFFGPRYGLKIIGAIQPSDFGEPSAKEVAELITQIKQESVPAVFGSEVFPSKVLEQIAKESGAKYVDTLRDDDLPSAPGDPKHTYLELMRGDAVTITQELGGDATALKAVDTTNVPGVDTNVSQPQ
ncbi:MAG TPA: metal ABC transporter substrate-binding protein [Anaerolineae bacterium]|nr:metal ABC transporter substrate-binding protein [Anaerolineae bacterium]